MKNYNITVRKKNSTEVIAEFTKEAENSFTARMLSLGKFRKENPQYKDVEVDVFSKELTPCIITQDTNNWQFV